MLELWGRRFQIFFSTYLIGMIISLYIFFLLESITTLPAYNTFYTLFAALFFPLSLSLARLALFIRKEKKCFSTPVASITDKLWKSFHWFIIGALLFGFWSGLYLIGNSFIMGAKTFSMHLTIDNYFGFRPQGAFVYLTVYWLFLFCFFSSKNVSESLINARTAAILVSLGVLGHFLFPVEIVRPVLEEATFSEWTLGLIYSCDNPVSCFPSTHCAMAFLATLIVWERNKTNGIVMLILTIAVGISTVVTRQHFFLDVIAGYMLAILVFALTYKVNGELVGRKWLRALIQSYERLNFIKN